MAYKISTLAKLRVTAVRAAGVRFDAKVMDVHRTTVEEEEPKPKHKKDLKKRRRNKDKEREMDLTTDEPKDLRDEDL